MFLELINGPTLVWKESVYFEAIYKLMKSLLATMTERGNKGYELHKSEANTFKLSFFGSILLFCNPLWLLISLALTLGISCY